MINKYTSTECTFDLLRTITRKNPSKLTHLDRVKARKILRLLEARSKNDAVAAVALGKSLIDKDSFLFDHDRGIFHLRWALDNGVPEAARVLATDADNGSASNNDFQSTAWYKIGFEHGDSLCGYEYAMRTLSGRGVRKNKVRAFSILLESSANADARVAIELIRFQNANWEKRHQIAARLALESNHGCYEAASAVAALGLSGAIDIPIANSTGFLQLAARKGNIAAIWNMYLHTSRSEDRLAVSESQRWKRRAELHEVGVERVHSGRTKVFVNTINGKHFLPARKLWVVSSRWELYDSLTTSSHD